MPPKFKKLAAANAREARAQKRLRIDSELQSHGSEEDSTSDVEVTAWKGGVNNHLLVADLTSDDEDEDYMDTGVESSEDEISELEGDELVESLQKEIEREINVLNSLSNGSAFSKIIKNRTEKEWKKIQANRSLGYTGNSERSRRRQNENARKKAVMDEALRKTKGANMMRGFLMKGRRESEQAAQTEDEQNTEVPRSPVSVPVCESETQEPPNGFVTDEVFLGYLSDIEEDNMEDLDDSETPDLDEQEDGPGGCPEEVEERSDASQTEGSPSIEVTIDESNVESISAQIQPEDVPESLFRVQQPPSRKRRRHAVPVRIARQKRRLEVQNNLERALIIIEKRIASKKNNMFVAGRNGLQSYRARAIQAHLHMVVRNGRKHIDASQRAAESQGFAPNWGGRLVRRWVKLWVQKRELPVSHRGAHGKVYSLLDDPAIRAELRSYLRTNKWAMDPAKLAEYTMKTSIPAAAEKYVRQVIDEEMPAGLKKYMELELFPRIQYRTVRKGVSLETARQFLHKEGFKYTEHKKALYYDGHERPDVVDYRQNIFLPAMEAHRYRLVEFTVGDVEKMLPKEPPNLVEQRLVIVAHDEMTVQQNDGKKSSWVLEGEHALKKKGNGRGLHYSGVICATHGLLTEAGQILEYGKNYEGYWTGELFVKQLREKIIPAFERAHGPGYQALIIVDNSQGHSAYSEDALLVSRMNFRPGGKQAIMRDGWFIRDGQKVMQKMVFPTDHPEFPGQAKGIRQVLQERGLWKDKLRMQCKGDCSSHSCYAKRILELQPDFQAQKSLVQEVIEEAGHLCLFLPKFHCELNYIEFFWGATKRWLRENCDYTFTGLQDNLPKAMNSITLKTIRKWEHRMYRWMDSYRKGLSAKDAQIEVRQFSSTKFSSHRRVSENLGRSFDN